MNLWLAFVAAAAVVLMIPGPTVFTVVGFSIAHGRRTAFVLAVTVALAHASILLLSALGLGAILSSNPAILSFLQICGAAYLVYAMVSIASRLWKGKRKPEQQAYPGKLTSFSNFNAIRHTYLVTLLNPSTLFFFVALLPQFLTPTLPAKGQLLVMSLTFVVLSALNSAVYGFSAATAVTQATKIGVREKTA